jgi:hypothetical protein
MKPTDFKKLIKEAVKEAIQEELKEILLEAVRAPKTVVTESLRDTYAQPHIEKPKTLTAAERRDMFAGMLGEMQIGGAATSQYANDFKPQTVDTVNGALPEGNVGLDQIMALMNGK